MTPGPFPQSPLHRLAPWLAALALASLLMLPGHGFVDGYDWGRMQLPYKSYYREALLDGRLPLWTPELFLGRPFLADIETATLYPPNLLFLLGVGPGAFASITLHLGLALWGGLRLGRGLGCTRAGAWLGSLVFALGAPLLGRLQSGQFQVFCALCWLPLLFVCAHRLLVRPDRRAAAGTAALLALLFLAGSPPVFWIAVWAAALWSLAFVCAKRPAKNDLGKIILWSLAALALAAALAAAQALPFLELVGQGNRSASDPAFALRDGMSWPSWTSLWLANPGGRISYWEYNLHSGLLLPPLALAALLRWRRPETFAFLCLGVFFALLAAGDRSPLLPWLVEQVPGWGLFRLPSRYALAAVFALGWLAALGLDSLLRRGGPRCPRLALALAFLVVALNSLDQARAYLVRAPAYARPSEAPPVGALAARLAMLGGPATDRPPPRVLAPPWALRENDALLAGFSSVTGFANPVLARVWLSLHEMMDREPGPDPVHLPAEIALTDPERLAALALDARWDLEQETWVFADAPPARAWLSRRPLAVADSRAAAASAVLSGADKNLVIVEQADAAPSAPTAEIPPAAGDHVRIERFSPGRIDLVYQSAAPAHLVLAEAWYPGWRARLGETELPVVPVNGWMRGVRLPAGSGRVAFAYQSTWFPAGLVLSLAGAAILLGLARPPRPFPRPAKT